MSDQSGADALTFHEISFEPVAHEPGEVWLRYPQIAGALGYERADRVIDLFNRNASEFTDSMTALVKLPTAGGVQEVRIFSLRGAHLLGMFARTERAAEFRRWVLDVLERQQPALPAPPAAGVPALVGDTFERVVAERDALRAMLAERVLKEEPKLRRVLYYNSIQGLTMGERAKLMGWSTHGPFIEALKRLAALGLVDYQPNPVKVATARRNLKNMHQQQGPAAPAKPKRPYFLKVEHPSHTKAQLDMMRTRKNKKAAAGQEGAHGDA